MKWQRVFLYSFFTALLILNGCSCNHTSPGSKGDALLFEDFEAGNKSSYTTQRVNFRSGMWYLKDALLGATPSDAKNGHQSVRLRNNGELQMQFDVNGAGKVTVAYAAYGSGSSGWQLLMSVNGGQSFEPVGDAVETSVNELQTVSFDVNHQGPVRFAIRKTTGGKSRLNIDDFAVYAIGGNHTGNENSTTTTATSTATDTASTGDNLLLGNPSNASASTDSADNYLMTLPYYSESYNLTRGEPNWVSWYVSTASLGTVHRLNDFRANTALPKGWYEVQQYSYARSGFQRGHNCPSADRTSSEEANSATFLMTNMMPQAPENNEKTWGNLENYERELVRQNNEIYVIAGSYGTGGTGSKGYRTTIDTGRVTVPSHIWKVIVVLPVGNNDLQRINANTRVIAVNTPNDNSIDPDWTKYLCTVRDIEKATGYNLLSKVSKAVQDAIESKQDVESQTSGRQNLRL